MFTEPKIVLTENVGTRGYISFYYNGKRYREYNAKKLNLDINPNQFQSYKDKLRLFKELSREFYKALLAGWSPEETNMVWRITIN